jgi:hypothetical protein
MCASDTADSQRGQIVLDALIKESERLSADIRSLEAMNEKFLGFGITIIGAGLAYGIKEEVAPMFPGLPIALFGVLYMMLDRLRSMMWLGGYKREIEDRINSLSGFRIANWERLVVESRGRGDIIVISVSITLFLILLGVAAYCIVQTYTSYGA